MLLEATLCWSLVELFVDEKEYLSLCINFLDAKNCMLSTCRDVLHQTKHACQQILFLFSVPQSFPRQMDSFCLTSSNISIYFFFLCDPPSLPISVLR